MSSNVEQGPNAGLLARAKEAARNPFLVELGKRVPSPRQAPIIGEILGLTIEERKNTRAVAWLNKYQPATLQAILSEASEAENKKPEEKEMEVKWGLDSKREKIRSEKQRARIQKRIQRGEIREEEFYDRLERLISKILKNRNCVLERMRSPSMYREGGFSTYSLHYKDDGQDVIHISPRSIFSLEGRINVYDWKYLAAAKAIGEMCEKRFHQKITIYKQY